MRQAREFSEVPSFKRITQYANLNLERIKQALPTDQPECVGREDEQYSSHKNHHMMSRWLEENAQEEPWSAIGHNS